MLQNLLSTILIASTLAVPSPERRLISLREGHKEWMTESQLLEIYAKKQHFIDMTDGTWDLLDLAASQRSDFAAPSYPVAPLKQSMVKSMIATVDPDYFKSFLDKFSAFNNRYYRSSTGVQSAQFLFDELVSIQSKMERKDLALNITKFEHSWGQFSVIAKLSSPISAVQDLVILGAHQDSINGGSPQNGRAPGYDDDGTGGKFSYWLF